MRGDSPRMRPIYYNCALPVNTLSDTVITRTENFRYIDFVNRMTRPDFIQVTYILQILRSKFKNVLSYRAGLHEQSICGTVVCDPNYTRIDLRSKFSILAIST